MRRLVFIARSLEYGGAERQLIELLRRIDKTLFEVFLVCLYPGGSLWDEANSIADVRVDHLGRAGRWDVGVIAALWRYMRCVDPHIVHGYMGIANVLALVGKPLGAKVVWGIRGTRVELSHYDFLHRVARWTERLSSRFPDLIICNSYAARRELEAAGYPRERMRVISNGIDVHRFRRDSMDRQAMRAAWGVGPDELLIGLVARFDPMKGHKIFMAAAKRILIQHRDVKFVVVGDGIAGQRHALQDFARELGLAEKVIWAGQRRDIPAVMSAFDLSVSASLFGEGFSNTLAESMSCGVPCVATNVGDSGRILGDFGWLVEPGDEAGLAIQVSEAIRICRSPEFRPELLRRRIESEFSLERLVAETTAALSSLNSSSQGVTDAS